MINLINLKIENFMSIEDMFLEFKRPGNYLITGYNEVGGDSNGSGKSTILNAIIWGLFGKTAKGLSGNEVTRWGSPSPARVTLQFDDSNRSLLSNCELNRTPDEITFSIAGKVTSGHKRDIQQTINETCHTNYDLFLSSVMFTKGQADFLTDSGDAAKKRLFKSLLRLEQIDKMYDKAREIYGVLKTQAQALDTELSSNQARIEFTHKELESYEIKKDGWEVKRLYDIESHKKQLQAQAPDIDTSLDIRLAETDRLIEHLNIAIQTNKGKEALLQEELSGLYRDIGHYGALSKSIETEKNNSEGLTVEKVCPYCGSKITKKGLAFHLQEKDAELAKINTTLNAATNRIRELESSFLSIKRTEEEREEIGKEYTTLSTLVAVQRQKIQDFDKTKKRVEDTIKHLEEEENPYTSICKSKLEEVVYLTDTTSSIKTQFDSILKSIDVYGYIKWVLSREGVVGAIIQKTFSRLEALINHYLSSICTEGFFISIKPQKELKSGNLKDEIEIVITQNGKKIPYAALSGGQEQRVTIAALLALYKLSKEMGMNRFNFLLLDEVLDLSLAEKGQQDIIRLLDGMEGEIRNIFVISHKDNLASEFPFQIDVRRETDGITKLIGVYQ
jgi:DNA repair exonuclease SbcCD ATPase subunit